VKNRQLLTPAVTSDFSRESKLVYWKQILPEKTIEYTTRTGKRSTVDFSHAYLSKLIEAYQAKHMDQTPFLLADKDNAHTMDPERYRAQVTALRLAAPGEKPGLYGKLEFDSRRDARAVVRNPNLGVSARIREDPDGPKLVHVLGTLDPQVTGMEPWKPVDLSTYDGERVLDLSQHTYSDQENPMRTKLRKPEFKANIDDYTETDIDEMSGTELDAWAEHFGIDLNDLDSDSDDADGADSEYDDDDDADADADTDLGDADLDDDDDPDGEPDVSDLSRRRQRRANASGDTREIELANSLATAADARAREALRRMADAEWTAFRDVALGKGVPPHLLDLAEPILNRPDDVVIDLSNSGEADVNVADVLRQFLTAAEGTIDMSNEVGHYGSVSGDEDPDAEMLEAWDNQFGR